MSTKKIWEIPIWAVLMILIGIAALVGMYGQAMYAHGFSEGLNNYWDNQKAEEKKRFQVVDESKGI